MQDLIKQLVVCVENYPELKSNDAMVKAMETYAEIEENIAASRRFYNSALRELKNKTQIFPGSLFAKFAGDVSSYAYFQADSSSDSAINVDEYLR